MGGLSGRPEKFADVCYSWWNFSSLSLIDKVHSIKGSELEKYILKCQDPTGGISDKPDNPVDVFHTYFGLAALSLLEGGEKLDLEKINPKFAIPENCLLSKQFSHLKLN